MLESLRVHGLTTSPDAESAWLVTSPATSFTGVLDPGEPLDFRTVEFSVAGSPVVGAGIATVGMPGAFPDAGQLARELGRQMQTRAYPVLKRALDVVIALVGLVVLAPLLLLVVFVITRDGCGSALFSQERCGRGGRTFRIFKFRTMVPDAERRKGDLAHLNQGSGPMFKIRRDPRVTRAGRTLRRFSVDEIPQLVNVLRGEMTLVGPRPSLPAEVANFTDYQRRRLEVTPGLTCLWQVSGRSDLSFEQWVELDVEYIRHRSLWLDLKILVRTIPAVVSGRGAY